MTTATADMLRAKLCCATGCHLCWPEDSSPSTQHKLELPFANLALWRFTMSQIPCSDHAADRLCDTASFADERNRYLRHCADHGASPTTLKLKRNELLWISRH